MKSLVRSPLKLPFLTAILLAVSFPRFNFFWLAWIALVPLLLELRDSQNLRRAFGVSYFAGFFFLLFSIHWLKEVSSFGLLVVCTYQAFYFAIFGVLAKLAIENRPKLFALVTIPATWVVLEWVRAEVPVMGFGWNLLAYSQSDNLLVIQSAKLLGAYGVSFLIVLVNVAIFMILGYRQTKLRVIACLVGFIPFALNVYYGGIQIQKNYAGPLVNVSVVQGNIEQEKKWVPGLKDLIVEKYMKLTELASFDGPDLVVWPEAAYPGFFNEDYQSSPIPNLVKKLGFYLLIGSLHQESEKSYYNSAYFLSKDGGIVERYDKIFLVPFGEYVPFKPALSFLQPYAYALGVSDFSAGDHFTVFEMPFGQAREKVRFSVLICFEDIFPSLARNFVLRGAQCLMVVTNDAWFGKSGAPYQHLQASVFRAIENGVSVVRAGNIGVSAFITPRGEVEDKIRNERGFETYVTGALTRPVAFVHAPTFYQKFGFTFPWFCFFPVLIFLFLLLLKIATADKIASV